jgi:hypothetical protein
MFDPGSWNNRRGVISRSTPVCHRPTTNAGDDPKSGNTDPFVVRLCYPLMRKPRRSRLSRNRAALVTSCPFMLGREKGLVHIWCFATCQKLKFIESRGGTVDVHHVANVNVVSSNLIGLKTLSAAPCGIPSALASPVNNELSVSHGFILFSLPQA